MKMLMHKIKRNFEWLRYRMFGPSKNDLEAKIYTLKRELLAYKNDKQAVETKYLHEEVLNVAIPYSLMGDCADYTARMQLCEAFANLLESKPHYMMKHKTKYVDYACTSQEDTQIYSVKFWVES